MASGDFTPLATQTEVQQAQTTADNAATAVGDANSGLTKDVADLQTEAANLQQQVGALADPVFALTTHDPSGVYKLGQPVWVAGSQYIANSDIDGSVNPITFSVGSGGNTWSPASMHNKEVDLEVAYGNTTMQVSPQTIASAVGSNGIGIFFNVSRKRLTQYSGGSGGQASLTAPDLMTFGDFTQRTSDFVEKSFTTNPTSIMVAQVTTSGEISYNSNITETELNYLDGVTSNIQSQLDSKLTVPSQLTAGSASSVTGSLIETSQSNLVFGTGGTEEVYISGGGSLRPLSSSQDLGKNDTNERWQSIYLANNPNVSSDRRLKADIDAIPDALLDVWLVNVKPMAYKLVNNKGKDSDRRQAGLIAQDVIRAFQSAGLDWKEWDVVEEDENGYLSLNYSACGIIESAAVRRKIGV